MKIYYVVNARLPNKKAYGIQVAKMCEAFVEAGANLELVIPRTRASETSLKDFYRLRASIPTKILPGLDWYAGGRVPFLLASVFFMKIAGLYLLWKRLSGERFIIYTVDMDTFSFTNLPLFGKTFAEMHDTKSSNFLTRFFFRNVSGIIATNEEIKRSLRDTFNIPDEKFIVEPNGVDLKLFEQVPSREEARKQLGIAQDSKVALYIGRFFDWKGLGILIDSAKLSPSIKWFAVGGTEREFTSATNRIDIPANLHIAGECALEQVPIWSAAADALLILGTKENERSYRYTSPMKAYEYMAAGRAIVASRTPALESIFSEESAVWYEPDNAEDLARSAARACAKPSLEMVRGNLARARIHSWEARATRIFKHIEFS